jgi:TonB family protein
LIRLQHFEMQTILPECSESPGGGEQTKVKFPKNPTRSPINFGALPGRSSPGKLKAGEGKRSTCGGVFHFWRSQWLRYPRALATAQNTPAPAPSARRITAPAAPDYPDLAKRMQIHGTVRVVRSSGSAKSKRILGGNPVLVDAALEAVGKWRFEAAPGERTEVIQIVFETQ